MHDLDVGEDGDSFNRTILELKPLKRDLAERDPQPFNRTILELKLASLFASVAISVLLIEPFWN